MVRTEQDEAIRRREIEELERLRSIPGPGEDQAASASKASSASHERSCASVLTGASAHQVVATKLDKVKSNARPKRKKELAAGCQLEPDDIVWTSTAKGAGIDQLRDLIRLWLTP